ncbi:hypothetical protein G7Y89_g2966 [Cudoniella acicularis]|uniref:MYND-type domain-containing protein n=1 Tax=Cudoniella acicularis TaxID=354080 RepID=A0A8H4RTH3_9HELO|nr:hypothetical protein G7Y89_g2966 [Cudoniella acicularis]
MGLTFNDYPADDVDGTTTLTFHTEQTIRLPPTTAFLKIKKYDNETKIMVVVEPIKNETPNNTAANVPEIGFKAEDHTEKKSETSAISEATSKTNEGEIGRDILKLFVGNETIEEAKFSIVEETELSEEFIKKLEAISDLSNSSTETRLREVKSLWSKEESNCENRPVLLYILCGNFKPGERRTLHGFWRIELAPASSFKDEGYIYTDKESGIYSAALEDLFFEKLDYHRHAIFKNQVWKCVGCDKKAVGILRHGIASFTNWKNPSPGLIDGLVWGYFIPVCSMSGHCSDTARQLAASRVAADGPLIRMRKCLVDMNRLFVKTCFGPCLDAPPGEEPRIRRCAKCNVVGYCSKYCQINAWPDHKRFCKNYRKPISDKQNPPSNPTNEKSEAQNGEKIELHVDTVAEPQEKESLEGWTKDEFGDEDSPRFSHGLKRLGSLL